MSADAATDFSRKFRDRLRGCGWSRREAPGPPAVTIGGAGHDAGQGATNERATTMNPAVAATARTAGRV